MKKFRIRFVSDYVLSASELWPDGDAPENPTIEDVLNLIDYEMSYEAVMDEWNLTPTLTVTEVKKRR